MYTKPLVLLAKKIGFDSKFFSDQPWKFSEREPMRYQLWMEELKQWIMDNFDLYVEVKRCVIKIPEGNFVNIIDNGYSYQIHNIHYIKNINENNISESYIEMLSAGVYIALIYIDEQKLQLMEK